MKTTSFLLTLMLICIPMACSAAMICPEGASDQGCTTGSYSWGGTTVTITASGEYTFAASVPPTTSVKVASSGVTLDGTDVTLRQIDGKTDLNLKNIKIISSGTAITECGNIENSSIEVKSSSWASGIGSLHGKMDNTTITVESTGGYAFGVEDVYGTGTISGGTFTVTSQNTNAYGVRDLVGTISGGTFTVTSSGVAYGVYKIFNNGVISGGIFTVTGNRYAYGVNYLADMYTLSNRATISGGEFTVTSDGIAFGVGTVSGAGTISGGTFKSVGKVRVYGIYAMAKPERMFSGGSIYAWGPGERTTAIGNRGLAGTYTTQYKFTYAGAEYSRAATVYSINNAMLAEIYGDLPVIPVITTPPTVTKTTNKKTSPTIAALICLEGVSEYQDQECATDMYSWNGSTVTITASGGYTLAENVPKDISIIVTLSGVTDDENDVSSDEWQPDLERKVTH